MRVPHAVVCLPTYNERENLEPMLRALGDKNVRVLVVDDNSPDGTGAIADAIASELASVAVLHRTEKNGLGKAYLAGTPLDVAYRQAGVDLPPPGTPVTNPLDPSALTAGAIGMFKDHYVVALSAAKALQDGQVVSLSSAASGPGFLGWMDPSAAAAPAPPPAAPQALVPGG